jgi:hypothetical protein
MYVPIHFVNAYLALFVFLQFTARPMQLEGEDADYLYSQCLLAASAVALAIC